MMPRIGEIIDRLANRVVRHTPSRRIDCTQAGPIVSFTFDDAPDSARTQGATILEQFGLRGTFYIAGGLVGTQETDRVLIGEDGCRDLVRRGHELSCHTYTHRRMRQYSPQERAADLDRNARFLAKVGASGGARHFAFPYIMAWPPAQSDIRRRFTTARGGLQGINRQNTDPSFLWGAEIRSAYSLTERLLPWVDSVVAAPGWLIFFTHDISNSPTTFGCKPDDLRTLIQYAVSKNCTILPVGEAAVRFGLGPPAL